MKARPIGMLGMTPAGWLNDLPRAASRTPEALPERHLADRTSKFTLLDDAGRGFGGAAEAGWGGKAGRRQRLVGIHGPGGERRLLFGAGEGRAEAVAGAKQESMRLRRQFVKKFVSEQWILSCKSLGRPLVYDL